MEVEGSMAGPPESGRSSGSAEMAASGGWLVLLAV